jgi:ribosome assembly protein YihI (activator of Der GTPase)
MTNKEDVVAHSFLSQESVDLLKAYLPTLEKKIGNAHLFPSNSESHISDEWMNRLLQRLADKAQINMNGKDFTFHCFRKMFLSAAIDSGIGMTAGKKLCGKAIAESDDTYLTTVHLREKFLQLKRFLAIKEQPKIEAEKIESLKSAINKLQEDLTQQKVITDTISEENVKVKKEIEKLHPLIDFVNELEENGQLQIFLDLLKTSETISFPDKGSFRKIDFSDDEWARIGKLAKDKGISKQEAINLLVDAGIRADKKEMKSGRQALSEAEK